MDLLEARMASLLEPAQEPSEEEKRFYTPDQAVLSLSFSPDSQLLAFGSAAGSVGVLPVEPNAFGPARYLSGHADIVTAVVFAPDGRSIVSSSLDGTVRVWGVK
jgi:WD40 repeat protein